MMAGVDIRYVTAIFFLLQKGGRSMRKVALILAMAYVLFGTAFALYPKRVEAKETPYRVLERVDLPGLRYVRLKVDNPPFSIKGLFREPDDNIADVCRDCGPCPEGCNAGSDCQFSYAYRDCWSGTCIIVCVYGCARCGSMGPIDNDRTNSCSSGSFDLEQPLNSEENSTRTYRGPVVVYDVGGRVVWRGQWSGRLPHLPRGVYVVRSPDGRFAKRAVVR